MPSCVLRYCTNHSRNSNKSQGVSFHRFPRPDQETREEWIRFVQKNRSENMWLPSEHAHVCSMHFKDDDKYTTKTGRVFLKKTAMPCDNPAGSDALVVIEVDQLSDSAAVSDSEPIFDTPKEITLKLNLEKENAAKRRFMEKVRILRRRNYFLKKKCNSYEVFVKNLKREFDLVINTDTDLIPKAKVLELHKALMKIK